MSSSEFGDFSDVTLAGIPDETLSGVQEWPVRSITPDAEIQGRFVSWFVGEPLRDANVSTDSLVALSGNQTLGETNSIMGGPSSGLVPLVATHVSPAASSMSPTPLTTGPISWSQQGIRLNPRLDNIMAKLIDALHVTDTAQVLRLLENFDQRTIREGVDMIIAGILEHESRAHLHAHTLQSIIRLLMSARGISFRTNPQFSALLNAAPKDCIMKKSSKPEETEEQTVLRVWGKDYRNILGLDDKVLLLKPLARLAHWSELLNQHPHQIAKYLNNYRNLRMTRLRTQRGTRCRITGEDIRALNRDLRAIVVNAHRQYTSALSVTLLTESRPRDESGSGGYPWIVVYLTCVFDSPEAPVSASEDLDSERHSDVSTGDDLGKDVPGSSIDQEQAISAPSAALAVADLSVYIDSAAANGASDLQAGAGAQSSTIRNNVETFSSPFSVGAPHRDQHVRIPSSHSKFWTSWAKPHKEVINLDPWKTALNIHGYTEDGSYRYDAGYKYKVASNRLVLYYNHQHAIDNPKYNGSWIVLPPLRDSLVMKSLHLTLSRTASRSSGLHPFHRLAMCSSLSETSLYLEKGNNIIFRNQDRLDQYPHSQRNVGRALEDLGFDADKIVSWKVVERSPSPRVPDIKSSVGDLLAKYSTSTEKFDTPRRITFTPRKSGLNPSFSGTFGEKSSIIQNYLSEFQPDPWPDDSDPLTVDIWTERISGIFPRHNGDFMGRADIESRLHRVGIYRSEGSALPWNDESGCVGFAPSGSNKMLIDERVTELNNDFQLTGNFNMAGLLEPLESAPHGSMLWMKIHYGERQATQPSPSYKSSFIPPGHAILFLAYHEYSEDDTVVAVDLHIGDVL
ncbi:hypothetical protein QFC19_001439 [Naganishia cerealis]|uniref:Uncharacterized protein n=1 Tax=Naganishia cerealis TaxID=610337 RepID=A0ACC2WHI3_9TREE|nr:hypothetical protein QFC19_001439 [Naganishia cerealis]